MLHCVAIVSTERVPAHSTRSLGGGPCASIDPHITTISEIDGIAPIAILSRLSLSTIGLPKDGIMTLHVAQGHKCQAGLRADFPRSSSGTHVNLSSLRPSRALTAA